MLKAPTVDVEDNFQYRDIRQHHRQDALGRLFSTMQDVLHQMKLLPSLRK